MKYLSRILCAAAAALALASCGGDLASKQEADELKISGQTMGTFYYITIPGGFPGGEAKLKQEVEAKFQQIIDAISSFDKNSEISRFNASDGSKPVSISNYLAHVIEEVNRQSLRIGGATDISIGPLVNLWGFGPDGRPDKIPADAEIQAAKTYVGMDKYAVRYIDSLAFLEKKDGRVTLDLSTVGEGLGADLIAAYLDEQHIQNYLVSIAGAIRTRGVNAKGQPWKVGIVDPVNPDGKPFAVVCPLQDAMSTSGSYRNYIVDKQTGERYSHIIDPKTGKPISHHTVSVTVIARNTLITDTLDTGLMVLGADKALDWGDATETPIYTIEMKNGKPVGRYNRYFEKYLKCQTGVR